jgi:hypothetical protein
MSPPLEKLGLEMVRDMVFPPVCERGEAEAASAPGLNDSIDKKVSKKSAIKEKVTVMPATVV